MTNISVENRHAAGLAMLEQVDGRHGLDVVESLSGVAPELGDWIIDFAFGEVYAREQLGLREREMVTLAILTTLGDTNAQLLVHIHGALNVGVTRSQIIEVLLHCVPYVGFPRVLNAIRTVKSAFENNAEETPQEASEHM